MKSPGNEGCDPFAVLDFYETNFWWNIGMIVALAIVLRVFAMTVLFIVIWEGGIKNEEVPEENTLDE